MSGPLRTLLDLVWHLFAWAWGDLGAGLLGL